MVAASGETPGTMWGHILVIVRPRHRCDQCDYSIVTIVNSDCVTT